jgi:hypothetical protein
VAYAPLGAVNVIDAVEALVAVAVPIVGAAGTLAVTEEVAFELADAVLIGLVAVTTQRITVPTYASAIWYVLDVAPLMLDEFDCH